MNEDSSFFEMKVRQVLCTIKIMNDANKIYPLIGKEVPFPYDSYTEHSVVKRLYRQLYSPKMTAADVDKVVDLAIECYHERGLDEN